MYWKEEKPKEVFVFVKNLAIGLCPCDKELLLFAKRFSDKKPKKYVGNCSCGKRFKLLV